MKTAFKIAVLAVIIVSRDVKIVQAKYVRKCLCWVKVIRTMFLSLFVLMVRQIIISISNLARIRLYIGLVQLLWMENSGFLVVLSVRFSLVHKHINFWLVKLSWAKSLIVNWLHKESSILTSTMVLVIHSI